MKIHEYQAKAVFRRFGIPVPRGGSAFTAAEAREAASALGAGRCVVKAQIHAGGRGKAGGVKVVASPAEAETVARSLLGRRLVTPQTGADGREVRRLLVEEALDIEREMYLAVVLDRNAAMPVVMASAAGGVDIEEVAVRTPERIFREHADPLVGFRPFQARRLAFRLGVPPDVVPKTATIAEALFAAFAGTDASLAEINPLVVVRTPGGLDVVALDAKLSFDDNGLHRHPDLRELRDPDEEDPLEVEASKYGLNYIKLDGSVGCMVNGAGLAMATMDIISLQGGRPANFLDVGGGASVEQVRNAFRILLRDAHVRAVLINIFGGIMRCDVVAQGVVAAARDEHVTLPVVVRLEGTNVEEGRRILNESGMRFTVASGMRDAAEKVVALAKGSGGAA